MDNEYTTILQETLDSFYEAGSKEEYEQIAIACRIILERAEFNLTGQSKKI